MPDALIIGGGPAGAAAGIDLARGGRRVLLLEKRRSAHDKVCGEFISNEAVAYLERLGINLPALGALPVTQLRLIDRTRMLSAELPFTAWSLSRRKLDESLLNCAVDAGVEVRTGVTVKAFTRVEHRWSVRAIGLDPLAGGLCSSGRRAYETLCSEVIFLATGKHDIRDWRRPAPANGQDLIGMKMHLRLDGQQTADLRGAVELFLFDEGYAGLELIERGRANLCLLIRKRTWQKYRSWSGLVTSLCRHSPHLAQRLRGSLSLWNRPLTIAGMPYGYLAAPQTAVTGLFRLGDQAAVIPSLAGDGIAMALRSADLASQVCLRGGSSGDYHQQVYRSFQPALATANRLTRLFASAPGRRVAFFATGLWPGLTQAAIRRTRTEPVSQAVGRPSGGT